MRVEPPHWLGALVETLRSSLLLGAASSLRGGAWVKPNPTGTLI